MEKLQNILAKIETSESCIVSKLSSPISISDALPKDLKYYLENYSSIILFKDSEYSIKINGYPDFKRANPVIIGEDAEEDRSYNWFIIGEDDNSQYITIDLSPNRIGNCYDSFWDRHGLAGDQPIIAKNFTELLEKLFESNGERWYWLEDSFISYGDAYDD